MLRLFLFVGAVLLQFHCARRVQMMQSFAIAPPGKSDIVVQPNDPVRGIQEAFDAVPDNASYATTIRIKNGRYYGKYFLRPGKRNVHIIGESSAGVVLTYDDHSGKPSGSGNDTLNTWNCWSTQIAADDCLIENVTFENSAGRTAGQAVALMVTGDRIHFRNCRFVGNQDTFFTNTEGRVLIDSTWIEGTTDYNFGAAVAVFRDCILHSKKKSHVTAASTPEGNRFGYVLMHCRLEADSGLTGVSLGRPWRPHAKVVYLNCEIGPHIAPGGWNNWRNPDNEKTAYYAEYKCTGPGAARTARVTWSHELTDTEAAEYTLKNIFAARSAFHPFVSDWNPE
jgi:pectinesterase